MGAKPASFQEVETFFKCGTYFRIVLENANYSEGSFVTGNIQFELTSNQPPLDGDVVIFGHESVLWMEELEVRTSKGSRKEVYNRDDTIE